MPNRYLPPSVDHYWVFALYLVLPPMIGSLVGALLAQLARRRGWRVKTSTLSMLFGVLAYAAGTIGALLAAGGLSIQTILLRVLGGVVLTWPISLIVGPIALIYIWQLATGRESFRDSTIVVVSALGFMTQLAFLIFFLSGSS